MKLDMCTYIGQSAGGCDQHAVIGRSYCLEHLPLIYKMGSAITRKKDLRTAASVWDLESEFNAAVEELVAEGYDFAEPVWAQEEDPYYA